jgi:hypothetical protein
MTERRPAVTASARVGVGNLRSGQKKACGAVEQKKVPRQESKPARKKCLRSWRRLENKGMVALAEQRN